jgi:hypothetical protein
MDKRLDNQLKCLRVMGFDVKHSEYLNEHLVSIRLGGKTYGTVVRAEQWMEDHAVEHIVSRILQEISYDLMMGRPEDCKEVTSDIIGQIKRDVQFERTDITKGIHGGPIRFMKNNLKKKDD